MSPAVTGRSAVALGQQAPRRGLGGLRRTCGCGASGFRQAHSQAGVPADADNGGRALRQPPRKRRLAAGPFRRGWGRATAAAGRFSRN
jgi:hypothetical protein